MRVFKNYNVEEVIACIKKSTYGIKKINSKEVK